MSYCGKMLILRIRRGSERTNKIWLKSLVEYSPEELKNSEGWIKVIDEFENSYSYIKNDDEIFYFVTNENAPRLGSKFHMALLMYLYCFVRLK